MRTLVIGAGGVGGYLAAQLAKAGLDVTLVARGAHGKAIREQGLRIAHERGEERVQLAQLLERAEDARDRYDLIVLAVKWPELETACDALPNLIAPSGVVVPLLNGLTSEDVVMTYVGAQRTIAAVVYMSAGLREPGCIYVNGAVRVGLAEYRPGQAEDIARIAALLERAQVAVVKNDDDRAMLWQKMIWNAPFNGLCALSERSAGYCVEHMEPLVRRAMREVIAVAAAEGVTLAEQLVDGMVEVTRSTFPLTEPSMLQDVRKGRPTEVEILQAEVVRRAERLGVDTPVLSTIAAVLGARPRQG
ncbi:MAG TPA: ketopantoate reductase family protein [Polyangiales bacterium]|nr:ketopantoate reductase family protein [Polyangiales bacterium]